jgi:hypothetical protein
VSGENDRATTADETVFQWHPDYKGQSIDKVRSDLELEIGRDQRAYELALQGAEESEHDALASVVDLERRWSIYDFGWHEADPASLARRITDFQWAREQQREMISWDAYRSSGAPLPPTSRASGGDWRTSMSDEQRRRAANIGAGIIVAVLVILVIVALVAIL